MTSSHPSNPTGRPALTIVVPTLNESSHISRLLERLDDQAAFVDLEVLVVDCGSTDGTRIRARQHGATLLEIEARGRAKSLNLGAAHARHDLILFLHADSDLSSETLIRDACQLFQAECEKRGHDRIAGHFPLRFKGELGPLGWIYRYYEAKTTMNRGDCVNGDQGMLLTRRFFQECGSFCESLPFLEDRRFADHLARVGEWIRLPGFLVTSARRFEVEGFTRRMILSALIRDMDHIAMPGFFENAGALYRAQGDASRLKLSPFYRLIHDRATALGFRGYFQKWIQTGEYIRDNAWQCFLYTDILLEPMLRGRRPFLKLYDRLGSKILRFPVFAWITASLTFIWFYTTFAYYALVDRRRPTQATELEARRSGT